MIEETQTESESYTDEEVEHAVQILIEAEKVRSNKELMALVRPLLDETHMHMGNVVGSISDLKKARQELPEESDATE